MYFTDSEAGQLCDNIRRILQEHGGCWITADPETGIQFVLTTRAIYGDRFMEVLLKDQKQAEDKSDVPVSVFNFAGAFGANGQNFTPHFVLGFIGDFHIFFQHFTPVSHTDLAQISAIAKSQR